MCVARCKSRPARMKPQLRHYPTKAAAIKDMAAESISFLRQRIEEAGQASLVLTGGSSPKDLYETWSSDYHDAIDWTKVHFFWGDERDVPHAHEESNTQVSKPLIEGVKVDPDKVHYWSTQLDAAQALAEMQQVLAKAEQQDPSGYFDLVLLGMGDDGHVASLFPPHRPWEELNADKPAYIRHIVDSPKPPSSRYTFTLPALNRARLTYLMPLWRGEARGNRRRFAG